MNEAQEILKLAKAVLSRSLYIDENNTLEIVDKAIRDGDTLKFKYTKKDGTTKMREITPNSVTKVRGRWVIKGVEVGDRRRIEKMFYYDMIGNREDEQEQASPIVIDGYDSSRFTFRVDRQFSSSADKLLKKEGGYWQSEKQGEGALAKLKTLPHGDIISDVSQKWGREAIGMVQEEWGKPNQKGFQGANGYVFDNKGVVARFWLWRKNFVVGGGGGDDWASQRLEDIYDDFGGKRRNIPPEMMDEVRDLERKTRSQRPPRVITKTGGKQKWERR